MKTLSYIAAFFCFLQVPAFAQTAGQSQTSGNLAVSLQLVQNDSVRITVKNVGKKTVAAYSNVICRENQYDYFELEMITADNKKLVFNFYDDRPTYAPVLALLSPNESFSHTISLTDWSERLINQAALKNAGLKSLPHGTKIRAKYLSSESESFNHFIWSGYVYSDWVVY
jgi:hypothetical protein